MGRAARGQPELILLRVPGYGQTGRYRDRPGFARIAHAVGGLSALAGMPDGPPVTPGSTSLGDYLAGLYGAVGALVALIARSRRRTGAGDRHRPLRGGVPGIGRAGAGLRTPASSASGRGSAPATPRPHGHFPTRDGKWVAIACTTDKMFAAAGAGDGAAGTRPRADAFGVQAKRLAARETVDRLVAAWTGSLDRDEVMRRCLVAEVPVGPLNSIADIVRDPQFRARDDLVASANPEAKRDSAGRSLSGPSASRAISEWA